jgi:hypothetical protein
MAPSKIDKDFKTGFSLLLSIMKVNYNAANAMNYSQTVYEWTLACMIADNKIRQKFDEEKDTYALEAVDDKFKEFVAAFNYARKKYMDGINTLDGPNSASMKGWAQSEILKKCFEINQAIFPIALAEGYLDLKDIAAGIGAGAGGIPVGRDT